MNQKGTPLLHVTNGDSAGERIHGVRGWTVQRRTGISRLCGAGGRLEPSLTDDPAGSFWSRDLELTEDGSSVLEGRVNRMELLPLERWIGGVHLTAGAPKWRRDPVSGMLIAEKP